MNRALSVAAAAAVVAIVAVAAPAVAQFDASKPALVDSNGNGRPDPGVDDPIMLAPDPNFLGGGGGGGSIGLFTFSGAGWDKWENCGGTPNSFVLGQPLFFPPNVSRSHGQLFQLVTVTSTDGGGHPIGFGFDETNTPPVPRAGSHPGLLGGGSATGSATLLSNGQFFDGASVAGSNIPGGSASMGFTYFDVDGDGWADYVSIPWAQSSLLGVRGNYNCGVGPVTNPQVFLPLFDSNTDGRPDTIAVVTPAGTLLGPPLGPAGVGGSFGTPVPGSSAFGIAALSAILAGAGFLLLRGRATS